MHNIHPAFSSLYLEHPHCFHLFMKIRWNTIGKRCIVLAISKLEHILDKLDLLSFISPGEHRGDAISHCNVFIHMSSLSYIRFVREHNPNCLTEPIKKKNQYLIWNLIGPNTSGDFMDSDFDFKFDFLGGFLLAR